MFCSQDRIIAKSYLNWKIVLDNWVNNSLSSGDTPIIIDELLKVRNF